ncbi:MAG TPA: tRNA lysidine(34) synthetase TilS, partial [Acidobacteriaceae bacterium]
FRAGERVAVAVSGGADSVALLSGMAACRAETGIVVSAVHVHHGLRGAEADGDAQFVADLAKQLELPLRVERGDVAMLAAARGQGIEEAARALRYRVFHELLASREVDAVTTAHTLDDQAETVLLKLLRGAWTEGLGGIAPVVTWAGGGRIVRPLLEVTRADIVAYLEARGQPWREDTTNLEQTFTRNRVRHTLLPQLRDFQPRIAEHLARMAAVARDEEAWWDRELARVIPGVVLPGRPVRGGGRANSTKPGEAELSMELERLRSMHPALQRRVLRAAAEQLGASLSFDQTEALRTLAVAAQPAAGRRGRVELGAGVAAERTVRELRLVRMSEAVEAQLPELVVPVPGVLEAGEYGLRVIAGGSLASGSRLLLRTPRAGDRLRLPHSGGVKTVKEVLERRGLSAAERRVCPVLATGSSILWMSGIEVEQTPGLQLDVAPIREREQTPVLETVPDAT